MPVERFKASRWTRGNHLFPTIIEVTETAVVDGRPVLVFNCLEQDLALDRRGLPGGVWVVATDGPLGPYDVTAAQLLADRTYYVGRLVPERLTGRTLFLAFRHDGPDGSFVGGICDPRPVGWRGDRLVLLDEVPAPA